MAISSMLLFYVVLSLVVYSTALLSDDLLSVERSNPKSSKGSSTDLANIISQSSGAINAAEASITNSAGLSNAQRATTSCAITALIFPDQVFTSTNSQYSLEQDVNW